MPNLASKVLRLTLDRLASDWQTSYGHPVLVVETFVDVAQFCGTEHEPVNGLLSLNLKEWKEPRYFSSSI